MKTDYEVRSHEVIRTMGVDLKMADARPTLHLICNAHLDPVWLWEWQEGAAEAISTFRSAADFCEEYEGFVFNHNEVILYRWVEEYEPSLFKRIQKLVKQGRWHIMGGWFLQPDCNMPSGESMVRQILAGRRYFHEKFDAHPTTAINFDPFGHSRGMVQILAKGGFDSYLVCRPMPDIFPLENDIFKWVGFDGSEVTVLRSPLYYLSGLGHVEGKYNEYMEKHAHKHEIRHLLWGVGNHGGGPSRVDLETLARLQRETVSQDIIHSTPEKFFAHVHSSGMEVPVIDYGLNPFAVGCYTSQIRIKQKHRELENELYATEKMVTTAWVQGLLEYPEEELQEAQRDLLTSEFHDILPGSSIQPAEDMAIRVLDHGLELLSRVKARAFFALSAGEAQPSSSFKAKDGAVTESLIPILVFNPHPHDVTTIVECEFQLPNGNLPDKFTDITVTQRRGNRVKELPTQVEQELSNLPYDWRKRTVFAATLRGGEMNRFDCRLHPDSKHPVIRLKEKRGKLEVRNEEMRVTINSGTGLIDRYEVAGKSLLRQSAFQPLVIEDNADPWGMNTKSFSKVIGRFTLLSPKDSAAFSGVKGSTLPPVRVIEDGAVRSVVEAVFGFNKSFMVITYKIPKQGSEIRVDVRVFWNEKDRMLKLSVPAADRAAKYVGQVMYGRDRLYEDGTECVSQKWVAALSEKNDTAVTIINDCCYGSSFSDGDIRLTLLRSPAYSAHPCEQWDIVRQDAFTPRIDQGERQFTFWLNGGSRKERLAAIDREALVKNEKPMALSFSPSGQGTKPSPIVQVSDQSVLITAVKKAEIGDDIIVRIFEPTGQRRKTKVGMPAIGISFETLLEPFEIKTYRINTRNGRYRESDLVEDL